jgi:hypothetical protein
MGSNSSVASFPAYFKMIFCPPGLELLAMDRFLESAELTAQEETR